MTSLIIVLYGFLSFATSLHFVILNEFISYSAFLLPLRLGCTLLLVPQTVPAILPFSIPSFFHTSYPFRSLPLHHSHNIFFSIKFTQLLIIVLFTHISPSLFPTNILVHTFRSHIASLTCCALFKVQASLLFIPIIPTLSMII